VLDPFAESLLRDAVALSPQFREGALKFGDRVGLRGGH
jgi:hypothetical protein